MVERIEKQKYSLSSMQRDSPGRLSSQSNFSKGGNERREGAWPGWNANGSLSENSMTTSEIFYRFSIRYILIHIAPVGLRSHLV